VRLAPSCALPATFAEKALTILKGARLMGGP